jgi:hypothetical protein
MGRGPADDAVVIVKPGAYDPAETSVRVKQRDSDREVGGEGLNT